MLTTSLSKKQSTASLFSELVTKTQECWGRTIAHKLSGKNHTWKQSNTHRHTNLCSVKHLGYGWKRPIVPLQSSHPVFENNSK